MACSSSSKSCKQQCAVKVAFDKAIAMADKAGFRQDAASGNELAGEFYFSRAYDMYMKCGADDAKADEEVKTKRGDFIKESKGEHFLQPPALGLWRW